MAFVRVYVKKEIRLERLTFNQQQMLKLGTVGLATVKNRVQSAKEEHDAAAKPLNKAYAITKSRVTRKRALRDLTYSGDMMRNLQVRTVSENQSRAGLTSRKQRVKGKVMSGIQRWLVFSPVNVQDTIKAARLIFTESVARIVKTS